ncbi:MAG: hypothetical protein SFZ23_02965 [Planctomycetota bacterium]|nr:hypothetical protein [Planctomycetota bacterium]
MNEKSGTAGKAVEPEAPTLAEVALEGAAGQVETAAGEAAQKPTGQKKEQTVPDLQPPSTEEEKDKRTSWIEIELVDEAGEPVRGVRYEITTPDEKLASGRLDANGFARVELIEPGTCKICFPELDKEAWEPASGGGQSQEMAKPTPVQGAEEEQVAAKSVIIKTRVSETGQSNPRTKAPVRERKTTTYEIVGANKTTEHAVNVLIELLEASGLTKATITSASRTPREQARVMYENLVSKGEKHQRELYGPNGEKVIDVYVANKDKSKDEVVDLMEAKILELGPSNVSHHCSAEYDVIDVAPSSIEDRDAFERAVRTNSMVKKYLFPPKDPAYHLEIVKE